MTGEYEVKKQILDIGRRIYQNGFVAANDGNISVKISDNEFLCTPTGGTSEVMVEPAAINAPSPTRTGDTRLVLQPMKAWSSITLRCFSFPS